MKELTLQQHTALPDDEKGKYREVWEWSANNSEWNNASVFDYENFQSYHTWIESDFIYLNPEYSTRQVFRLIEQPVEEIIIIQQTEVERLMTENGILYKALQQIHHMSDCGSYLDSMLRMKGIASDALKSISHDTENY